MDWKSLIPIVIQLSLILMMVSVGLRAQWHDLTYALSRPGLLFRGFVAVNVVVPLVAIVLVLILPMATPIKFGIAAMAVSPLAPFTPGKMMKAGADASFALGTYLALLLLAVVIVPATLVLIRAVVPEGVTVGVGEVARLVVTSVLLPLGAGLTAGTLAPDYSRRIAPTVLLISNIALLLVVAPILFVTLPQIAAVIGSGALLAIVVIVGAGLAAGHLLGAPDPHHRIALAVAAATRHPGIAGLVVHQVHSDPRAMLAVVLFLLVSVVVSAIYMKWAFKRLPPTAHRFPTETTERLR